MLTQRQLMDLSKKSNQITTQLEEKTPHQGERFSAFLRCSLGEKQVLGQLTQKACGKNSKIAFILKYTVSISMCFLC